MSVSAQLEPRGVELVGISGQELGWALTVGDPSGSSFRSPQQSCLNALVGINLDNLVLSKQSAFTKTWFTLMHFFSFLFVTLDCLYYFLSPISRALRLFEVITELSACINPLLGTTRNYTKSKCWPMSKSACFNSFKSPFLFCCKCINGVSEMCTLH